MKEYIKKRTRENTHPNTRDWHALNEEHVLGPARCVEIRALRHHIIIDHGVDTKGATTALELGRLHMLAHALIVHPDLRELIGGNALKWEFR